MENINNIIKYFENAIPKELSEPWDNDGAMINCGGNVTKAVCALDATSAALEYAKQTGAELILTHHPLIFDKLDRISIDSSVGKRAVFAIKNGISILSYHTRLDALPGGVNDMLIKKLELEPSGKFANGLGRTVQLDPPMEAGELAEYLNLKLNTDSIKTYSANKSIKKLAILGGSGKSFIKAAAESGADAYFTGEVNHSGIIDAKEESITLFTSTHYITEAVVLSALKEIFKKEFPDITCEIFYEYQNF